MVVGVDLTMVQKVIIEIGNVSAVLFEDGFAKGEIEIAIEQKTIPVHTDLVTAHQIVYRVWIKVFGQQMVVLIESATFFEIAQKLADGAVGDCDQACELDSKTCSEFLPIIAFEIGLHRRK